MNSLIKQLKYSGLKSYVKRLCIVQFLFFLAFSQIFGQIEPKTGAKTSDCVILLHGLGRTSHSMKKLEKSLSFQGYRVINLNYPSTKYSIEFLAEETLGKAIEQCNKTSPSKIHFVTHSMGGIIVRYYLKHHKLSNLGRVVMLSPPNQGSELVNHLKDSFIFKKINGPAAQQLGTGKDSIPLKLGAVDFELGVITGKRSLNPLNSIILPGADDGAVSVEGAKVASMKDFIVLPHSHAFIMRSKDTIEQVLHFLKYGKFRHKNSTRNNADSNKHSNQFSDQSF